MIEGPVTSTGINDRQAKAESGYTPDRITQATRRLDVALAQLLGTFSHRVGVSVPEMLALEHAGAAGQGSGIGPSELARRLHMTTGAVTALADRLADSGHLARAAHPTDRRRVLLERTRKAETEVLREVLPLAADVRQLADGFSQSERDAIGSFLDQLIAIVERHAQDAPGGSRPGLIPAREAR